MADPIMFKERPKKFGLGYVQYNVQNSKAMKESEATSKRTFVPSSKPQTCQVCFQVDFHCLKPMLQQEDCRHASYGEHSSSDNFQDMNTDVSLQEKAGASTSSSPHEGKKIWT